MKRRHHCKTSQAKVMLAVLALCGVTAFWGSVAWAADAGQAPVLVQDGTHYFSVNPENGNRDKNYNNDGAVGKNSPVRRSWGLCGRNHGSYGFGQ